MHMSPEDSHWSLQDGNTVMVLGELSEWQYSQNDDIIRRYCLGYHQRRYHQRLLLSESTMAQHCCVKNGKPCDNCSKMVGSKRWAMDQKGQNSWLKMVIPNLCKSTTLDKLPIQTEYCVEAALFKTPQYGMYKLLGKHIVTCMSTQLKWPNRSIWPVCLSSYCGQH